MAPGPLTCLCPWARGWALSTWSGLERAVQTSWLHAPLLSCSGAPGRWKVAQKEQTTPWATVTQLGLSPASSLS